jgi:hypothetical protein
MMFVPILTVALGTALATTTDELTISSGATTVTIVDNGAGDTNGAAGTINYSNSNFGGWNISIASGTSHSPSLTPFGLDVASLTATCTGGPCTTNALDITFSDINFSVPVGVGGFQTTFSTTQTGTGTAAESAYFSNSNAIFAPTTLIGTVGPFSTSSVGSAHGGAIAAVPNYSLTLAQVFTDTTGGAVSFSVDGNITAVPEPSAIMLFGAVLFGSFALLRRRKGSIA